MKLGVIYFPIVLAIVASAFLAVQGTSFFDETSKKLISTAIAICFIVYMILVIFQPYEK